MLTSFGTTPASSLGLINTKELPYLTRSGFYKLQITSATYRKGVSKTSGNEYQQLQLALVTIDNEKPTAKFNLSVFISETSQELQDLVYFCNVRDKNGTLYLPDPLEHKWTNKEGMPVLDRNGQQVVTYEFKELNNKIIHGIVIFKGMAMSSTGTQFPTFELTGFTSAQGKSAYEDANKLPAAKYKKLIEFHRNGGQQSAPAQQSYAQPQPQFTDSDLPF